MVGIWRWLGRQARYEQGSQSAEAQSAAVASAPTLLSTISPAGRKVLDADGSPLGVVVDAMMRCSDAGLEYVVVSEGGVAGVGERLHAVSARQLTFSDESLKCGLTGASLAALPVLEPGTWPASADER